MPDYTKPEVKTPVSGQFMSRVPRHNTLKDLPSGAMRFMFDLTFSWSYPGGGTPATRAAASDPLRNQIVYDMAERADGLFNGAVTAGANDAVYAGGGFDYSTIDRNPYGVRAATDAWASIHGAENAYFAVCTYCKMPVEADWASGVFQIFSSATSNGFWTTTDPLIIGITTAGIAAYRQTTLSAKDMLTLPKGADFYGKVCQVGYWRDASGQGFRMKSIDGTVSTSASVGAESNQDYSALAPCWGDARTGSNGAIFTSETARKHRNYTGFLEDLNMSGREPVEVLDAHWTGVQARISESAAANGGVSLIYV